MGPLIYISIIAIVSVILNGLLVWYIINLLRKLLFISLNLSDIFLTFRSFQVFTESIYEMVTYNKEPVIEELIQKTKLVLEEVETFRDVFEYTIDKELEEELNITDEEIENE
tara:strand:+ start:266 stop:601 length:336 start_codon:yes stop_codon:yes gene_type:complete